MPGGNPLIFDWPGRHNLHIALPLALLVAAFLHAGVFTVFSIVYPRPEIIGLSDRAEVYFVTPGTPVAGRLEELLLNSDPAIFAPGRGLTRTTPASQVDYIPQYDSRSAALEPLLKIETRAPNAPKSYGPPSLPRTTFPGPPPSLQTRLTANGSLAARLPELPESARFEVRGRHQGLGPTVFFAAIRPDGSVAHIMPESGSGDATLDESALKLLKLLKFAPAAGSVEWGFVSFSWGADVKRMEPE